MDETGLRTGLVGVVEGFFLLVVLVAAALTEWPFSTASAAGMSSRPDATGRPRVAETSRLSRMLCQGACGRSDHRSAIAPTTVGDAIDVPVRHSTSLFMAVDWIALPGAAMLTEVP